MIFDEYESRTDLALEATEKMRERNGAEYGIDIAEENDDASGLKITRIEITDKEVSQSLGTKQGIYITAENMEPTAADDDRQESIADKISEIMSGLLRPYLISERPCILVVGLGNKEVTPDSLGPLVTEYMSVFDCGGEAVGNLKVTAIAPGVMAQTGMETAEIIRGIVSSVHPDAVIAIDALAARSSARLNTTIQLSNTGINPGSGVGNHRMGLTIETIGVPVIAVGIPTVIETATIVHDAILSFAKVFADTDVLGAVNNVLEDMTEEERRNLMPTLIPESMSTMYVTPRDVDASVQRTAYIVAQAINKLAL